MSLNKKLTDLDPDLSPSVNWEQLDTPFPVEKIGVISRREEKELAQKARKKRSLRYRKPYTRKKGTVHPKKKAATKKRQRRERWSSDPFWCVAYGHGCHALDKSLWDKHIAPFWEQYDPKDLVVERYKGYGTKAKPYTVWTLRVLHREQGLLWDGSDALLYQLSSST